MAKPSEKPHYVNNRKFSEAVVDYVRECNRCEDAGDELPKVPEYIANCFIRIAEGLSHRPNFIRYTYREDMVWDAIENCLRAVRNYNIDAATRTGKPNAFSYFTQICYFAFLRRIDKEKKQQKVKDSIASKSMASDLMYVDENGEIHEAAAGITNAIKSKNDSYKERDSEAINTTEEGETPEAPKKSSNPSKLELFYGEDSNG